MSYPGIDAESAAVFGYGLVLAHADADISAAARSAMEEHRERRDDALDRWPDAPAPPAGYSLTMPLANSSDALLLAIRLESDCCDGWRAQLAAENDAANRVFEIGALSAAALRMTRWRTLVPGAPFEAFPGFGPDF